MRRTTWRCGSSRRTRGSGSPRCVRRRPTSACRCCCAAATPWATRPTRPRSPTRSSTRRPRPASTSSASSTRSTTSTRCGRRSRPYARPAPPSPRSRSATPPTCPTPTRSSTRSTTTSSSPTGSSTPAPTCWRSRTWPGCCARPPLVRSSRALRERFDLPVHLHTHDTPGGQLATLGRGDRGRGRRGGRRLRCTGRHHEPAADVGAGRGHEPLRAHDRPRHRRGQRARALLGGHPPRSTRRSSPACRRRPAGSTGTRSPAASSPTCASRPSRWDSARSSSRSRTCTPPRTTSSATSSR